MEFALRNLDFRGRWSATPKNRGRSAKTQGWTALKTGAVFGQWVASFKEAVPPPLRVDGHPLIPRFAVSVPVACGQGIKLHMAELH